MSTGSYVKMLGKRIREDKWRTIRVSVIDGLLGLGSDLVRDHIELTSYDDVKRAEIGVFNAKVVEVKL